MLSLGSTDPSQLKEENKTVATTGSPPAEWNYSERERSFGGCHLGYKKKEENPLTPDFKESKGGNLTILLIRLERLSNKRDRSF